MDMKGPDFSDFGDPIFADSRDPIFNSSDPNRVAKTPLKNLQIMPSFLRTGSEPPVRFTAVIQATNPVTSSAAPIVKLVRNLLQSDACGQVNLLLTALIATSYEAFEFSLFLTEHGKSANLLSSLFRDDKIAFTLSSLSLHDPSCTNFIRYHVHHDMV